MSSVRKLHIRRLADIVTGSLINGAKTKVQKLALRKQLDVSGGRSILNETIRNNSPTIYLVDPDLISSCILDTISNGSNQYVTYVETPEGRVQAEDKEFNAALEYSKINISNLFTTLSYAIRKELYKDYSSISIQSFEDMVTPVYNKLISDILIAEKAGKSRISFQIAAARAGSEIRRQLNIQKIRILENAGSIFDNLGNRIPFIGYRFSGTVTDINKSIQTATNRVVSALLGTTDKFIIGNLVHAGHVGIYSDSGLLGINMPDALISGLISNKFSAIEEAIGNISIHIDNGIRLNTNYTNKAGMFLDLQFNFAVSMPETLNSRELSPIEVSTVKSIVGNLAKNALSEAMKTQITDESILELSKQVGASPSFIEYLSDVIPSILKNTEYELKHNIKAKSNQIISNLSSTNKTRVNSKPKIKAPNKLIINLPNSRTQKSSINLLAILQAGINKQVAKNMGQGNEHRVLNYRTGRFAESVQVQRLSESRQGMITAFYSYMRNPYGTFSEGGRQQFPKTRDPKLLISKSVRELAAPIVSARMRAVLV